MHAYNPCFTLDPQRLWQSTHAWAYVEKRAKYFEGRTHTTMQRLAWQCMSFTLTFAWNRHLKTNFHAF